MSQDVDSRYREAMAEVEAYLPFVENLIKVESKERSDPLTLNFDLSKLKSLVSLLRSNSRVSLESLTKCKAVFAKIHNKMNKPHLSVSGANKYERSPATSSPIPSSSKNDTKLPDDSTVSDFEAVRAKLNLLAQGSIKKEDSTKVTKVPCLFPSMKSELDSSTTTANIASSINLDEILQTDIFYQIPNEKIHSKHEHKHSHRDKDTHKSRDRSHHGKHRRRSRSRHRRSRSKDKRSSSKDNSSSSKDKRSSSRDKSSSSKDKHSSSKDKHSSSKDKHPSSKDKKSDLDKMNVNKKDDIDILEELQSELRRQLELEDETKCRDLKGEISIKSKENNIEKKAIEKATVEKTIEEKTAKNDVPVKPNVHSVITNADNKPNIEDCSSNSSNVEEDVAEHFESTPISKLSAKIEKDVVFEDEIVKALNREIGTLNILLPSASSSHKKELMSSSDITTKPLEVKKCRRISLDTYKEKVSAPKPPQTKVQQSANVLSCPASPDQDDSRNVSIAVAPIPSVVETLLPLAKLPIAPSQHLMNTKDVLNVITAITLNASRPLNVPSIMPSQMNQFSHQQHSPLPMFGIGGQNFSDIDMRQYPLYPQVQPGMAFPVNQPNRNNNFMGNSPLVDTNFMPYNQGQFNNMNFPNNTYANRQPNVSFNSNNISIPLQDNITRNRKDNVNAMYYNYMDQNNPGFLEKNEFDIRQHARHTHREQSMSRDDFSHGRSIKRERSVPRDDFLQRDPRSKHRDRSNSPEQSNSKDDSTKSGKSTDSGRSVNRYEKAWDRSAKRLESPPKDKFGKRVESPQIGKTAYRDGPVRQDDSKYTHHRDPRFGRIKNARDSTERSKPNNDHMSKTANRNFSHSRSLKTPERDEPKSDKVSTKNPSTDKKNFSEIPSSVKPSIAGQNTKQPSKSFDTSKLNYETTKKDFASSFEDTKKSILNYKIPRIKRDPPEKPASPEEVPVPDEEKHNTDEEKVVSSIKEIRESITPDSDTSPFKRIIRSRKCKNKPLDKSSSEDSDVDDNDPLEPDEDEHENNIKNKKLKEKSPSKKTKNVKKNAKFTVKKKNKGIKANKLKKSGGKIIKKATKRRNVIDSDEDESVDDVFEKEDSYDDDIDVKLLKDLLNEPTLEKSEDNISLSEKDMSSIIGFNTSSLRDELFNTLFDKEKLIKDAANEPSSSKKVDDDDLAAVTSSKTDSNIISKLLNSSDVEYSTEAPDSTQKINNNEDSQLNSTNNDDDSIFFTLMEQLLKKNAVPEKFKKVIEIYSKLKDNNEDIDETSVTNVVGSSSECNNVEKSDIIEADNSTIVLPDKKIKKGYRDLHMLQQDLKKMFMCNDVLGATGRRAAATATTLIAQTLKETKSVKKTTKTKPSPNPVLNDDNLSDTSVETERRTLRSAIRVSTASESSTILNSSEDKRLEIKLTDISTDTAKQKVVKGRPKGSKAGVKKTKKVTKPKKKRTPAKKNKNKTVPAEIEDQDTPMNEEQNVIISEISVETFYCSICNTTNKDIVRHYKTDHPKDDVPSAKLDDAMAKNAISLAMLGNVDGSTTSSSQKCILCKKVYDSGSPKELLHHLVYCHTGEYEPECNSCISFPNGTCSNECIEGRFLPDEGLIIDNEYFDVKGYICELCNYIQVSKLSLNFHILKVHPGVECHIIKISLTVQNYNPNNCLLVDRSTNLINVSTPVADPVSQTTTVQSSSSNNLSCDGIFSSSLQRKPSEVNDINIKEEIPDFIDYNPDEIERLTEAFITESNHDQDDDKSQVKSIKISDIRVAKISEELKYMCSIGTCEYSAKVDLLFQKHLEVHDLEGFTWDGKCDQCNIESMSGSGIHILEAFNHNLTCHMPESQPDNNVEQIALIEPPKMPENSSPICISNVFSLVNTFSDLPDRSIETESDNSPEDVKITVCHECQLEFASEEKLANHFLVSHVENGIYERFFKCDVGSCLFQCHKADDFTEHLSTQHSSTTFWSCFYCKTIIPKYSKMLVIHMQTEHVCEAYKCKMCDYRTSFVKKMILHIPNAHGNKCRLTFLRIPYQALPKNISKSTDDVFLCACGFSTNIELIFRNHLTIGESSCRICNLCDKEPFFKSADMLLTHYVTSHIWKNRSCNYCNYRAANVSEVKKHAREVHNVFNETCWRLIDYQIPLTKDLEYFSCGSCPFSQGSPSALFDHISLHDTEDLKKFICKHCQWKSTACEALLEHIYVAHYPWANYSRMYDFDITDLPRVNSQPPVLPYICSESCPKYLTSETFLKHLWKCTVKPKCQCCEYCSQDPDDLVAHLAEHHSFKLYNCVFCCHSEDTKYYMKCHLLECHQFEQPLTFIRYNFNESPRGVLLLLNLNTLSTTKNLLCQIITAYDQIWSVRNNMAITTGSETQTAIMPSANTLAIMLTDSTSDKAQVQEEEEIIIESDNDEDDPDKMYIAEDLDFKTTILKRESISSDNSEYVISPPIHTPNAANPDLKLTGTKLFICAAPKCLFETDTAKRFHNHCYHCAALKVFGLQCFHCKRVFHRMSMLLDHVMTHSPAKYICGTCKSTFSSGKVLSIHFKKAHKASNVQIVPVDPMKTDADADTFIGNIKGEPTHEIIQPTSSILVKLAFDPSEIDTIPNRPIFSDTVRCKVCSYENKVRTNIVRHLQMHLQEGDACVPSSAPVNPVPHLETNEMFFDKMTNLALSSNIDKPKASKPATHAPSTPIKDNIPKFIVESKRLLCGMKSCSYTTNTEDNFRYHWELLHPIENTFSCKHCDRFVITSKKNKDLVSSALEHLELHKEKLYQCPDCNFLTGDKDLIKTHALQIHSHDVYVTIREGIDNSAKAVWQCAFCDVATMHKKEIIEHSKQVHKFNHQFKCDFCTAFRPTYNLMTGHIKKDHPGLPFNMTSSFFHKDEVKDSQPPASVKRSSSSAELNVGASKKPRKSAEVHQIDPSWTFGSPKNGKYSCSICNVASFNDEMEMESHLQEELKYQRYGCMSCKFKSHSETVVINHSQQKHDTYEVKLFSKIKPYEDWIKGYISHQKSILSSPFKSDIKIEPNIETLDTQPIKEENKDSFEFVDDAPNTSPLKNCPHCNVFVKNLKVHIMRHMKIKKFKCNYCEYDAVTMIEARQHIKRSHKGLPISVMERDDVVIPKDVEEAPRIVKTEKKPRPNKKTHVCTACKTEICIKEVSDHRAICHPNSEVDLILSKTSNVVVCSLCSIYAVNDHMMNFHFTSAHPGAEVKSFIKDLTSEKNFKKSFRRFSCKYCSINYQTFPELHTHFNDKHSDILLHIVAYTTSGVMTTGEVSVKESFQCIITGCDYVAENALELLFHVRSHYKSYYCETCSIYFPSQNKYLSHPCPEGVKPLKMDSSNAILKQRLQQVYDMLMKIYKTELECISFDDYLHNIRDPNDKQDQDVDYEPSAKKLKQVAKKSTAQVHPMHESALRKSSPIPPQESSNMSFRSDISENDPVPIIKTEPSDL